MNYRLKWKSSLFFFRFVSPPFISCTVTVTSTAAINEFIAPLWHMNLNSFRLANIESTLHSECTRDRMHFNSFSFQHLISNFCLWHHAATHQPATSGQLKWPFISIAYKNKAHIYIVNAIGKKRNRISWRNTVANWLPGTGIHWWKIKYEKCERSVGTKWMLRQNYMQNSTRSQNVIDPV